MRIRADAGFTLLEVLVATAIAAMALVVLFQAGGGGLLAANTAARTEQAIERAQSHLAGVGRDVALLQGESTGDDGGGYRWRISVSPLASWPDRTAHRAAAMTLFDVEVMISWRESGRRRNVVLRTRRLAPVAAAPQ